MAAPVLRSLDVDDDGSGTTGTERNAAWKTAVYDATDTANLDVLSITSTGTFDQTLSADGDVYLRWNGGAAGVVRSFTNPSSGRAFFLENVTAAQTLRVSHQDTGAATAANRVICESTAGQWLGPGGIGFCRYDSTTSRWRFYVIDPGAPITRTFAAGNYTANGAQTWTVASGDVMTDAYVQRGKQVTFWFNVVTSTVGGTPNTELRITLPGGFTATKTMIAFARVIDNGTGVASLCFVAAGTTFVTISASVAAAAPNWTASTDNTAVQGTITFEVD